LYLAKIKITLRKSLLDPQGKTVEHSLLSLGFNNIKDTRIGKYIELSIDAGSEKDAEEVARHACQKLLANPVMEDFEFEIINPNGS
jgi:phosphoribosylformylglycinamidine synthase PurS subunit